MLVTLVAWATAWPLTDPSGALGYYDNALHVEELRALAGGDAIADLSCLGIDLHALHTPLYRVLAWIVAAGVPPEVVMWPLLPLSLTALGLAGYHVAARRVAPWIAFVIATLVVVSPAELRGTGAVYAGMWSFALATALLTLFIDRLGRSDRSAGHHAIVGLLGGAALWLHLFAVYPLALAYAVALIEAARARDRRRALHVALAGVLTVVIPLPYVVPVLRESMAGLPSHFNPPLVPMLLALVSSLPPGDRTVLQFVIGQLPAYALLLLVLVAPWKSREDDGAPQLARAITLILFTLVIGVAGTDATFLGPLPARLAQLARAGWPVLAALGLARLTAKVPAPRPALVAALGIAAGVAFAAPLSNELDEGPMAEARALRDDIVALHPEGRVAVAMTFGVDGLPWSLGVSQAITAPLSAAGVPVVGAYYSSLPPRARAWTMAAPHELFGVTFEPAATEAPDLALLLTRSRRAAVSHLVVHEPSMVAALAQHPELERVTTSGRHHVFRDRVAARYVEETDVVARRTGPLAFEVTLAHDGPITLSLAFHPSLAAQSDVPVSLAQADDGRTLVTGLTAGAHPLTLFRHEPPWPWPVALLALIAALATVFRDRGRGGADEAPTGPNAPSSRDLR